MKRFSKFLAVVALLGLFSGCAEKYTELYNLTPDEWYAQVIADIKESSQLRIYNIIVVALPLEKSTVNFVAPIVCNMDNMTLSQVVLDVTKYPQYGQAEMIENFIQK